MSLKITKKEISELQKRYAGMQNRVKGLKAKAEEVTETLITAAEVGATAFGFGLMDGYWVSPTGERGVQILGVPLDLGTAGALHILAFVGRGRWASHWHAIANGALASYLTKTGAGMGDRMRIERGGAAAAAPAAAAGAAARLDVQRHSELVGQENAPLTDEELLVLARA